METEAALIVVPPQITPYGGNHSPLMIRIKLLRLSPNLVKLTISEHQGFWMDALQPGATLGGALILEERLLSRENAKFEKLEELSSHPQSGMLHQTDQNNCQTALSGISGAT